MTRTRLRRIYAAILAGMLAITLCVRCAVGQTCQPAPWHYTLVGQIDEDTSLTFRRFLTEMTKAGAKDLVVHISSPGGDANASIEMIRAIKGTDIRTTCIASGLTASAAYVFLQTCDRRLATPGTTLATHRVYATYPGGILTPEAATGMAQQILAAGKRLEALAAFLDSIVYGRMGLSEEEYLEMVGEGRTWKFSAGEGVQLGALDGLAP